jgi:putative FmdB family regulatory protein
MPIYEFVCAKCGNKFETLFRTQKDAAPKCPSCGGADVKKVFSVLGGVTVKSANACGGAGAQSHSHETACPSCSTRGCPMRD